MRKREPNEASTAYAHGRNIAPFPKVLLLVVLRLPGTDPNSQTCRPVFI